MKNALAVGLLVVLLLAGCSKNDSTKASGATIKIDGSSTVLPILEAVIEEFKKENPQYNLALGRSGTGGGFKKFARAEIDISNASRPIKASEAEDCAKNGVEYIELPVAYDALAVVVHPDNDWCNEMTVSELKKLWEPAAEKKVTRWSQIRAGWPDEPIQLYGAGTDSGTFDYFTSAIVGEEGASRPDYTASEDDNTLVTGVAGSKYALGYFGVHYLEENRDRLKAVKIINDTGGSTVAVEPTADRVIDGTYQPLARPLFIYVNKAAAERPEVKAFIDFLFTNIAELTTEAGYVPLPNEIYDMAKERWGKKTLGSVFGEHGSQVGVKLTDLYKAEKE